MAKNSPISSFVLDKADITQDDLWKLMMFCSCADNLKNERWELDMTTAYGHCWISGRAEGEDEGKFWNFLISNKLDDKIEIIRG